MASNRHTIITVGSGTQKEAPANAAITPGQLIELLSTGKIQKQATAATDNPRSVAIENYLKGDTINDDYVADDQVLYRTFKRGDEVLLIMKDAQAATAIGDTLEAAVDGEVQRLAAGVPMFEALEAIDVSGGSVALDDRRFVCRVL